MPPEFGKLQTGSFFPMAEGDGNMSYIDVVNAAGASGYKKTDYVSDPETMRDAVTQAGGPGSYAERITRESGAGRDESVRAVADDDSSLKIGSKKDPRASKDSEAKADKNAESAKELTDEELEAQREKAKELTAKLNAQNIGLSFAVDDKYDRMVINVTNRGTKDVVRQIPSEDLMHFEKIITDFEDKTKSAVADSKAQAGAELSQKSAAALKGLILDETA